MQFITMKIIIMDTIIITNKTTIQTNMEMNKIYDITIKGKKSEDISLTEYKDKVLLIINTASRCGFTKQYTEIEELHKKYSSQGFEILDFPCNQFGNQAPESDEELSSFCSLNYKTNFPQFKKIEVNGENEAPLYTYLKNAQSKSEFDLKHPFVSKIARGFLKLVNKNYKNTSDIKWNFTKFLVNKQGEVIARFEPNHKISEIESKIKELL